MEKEYSLIEIINKLVGHTDIACETRYDDESYNNLELIEDIGNYILEKLYNNARWKNDYRASANSIANRSIDIAKNFQCHLDDILSYDED